MIQDDRGGYHPALCAQQHRYWLPFLDSVVVGYRRMQEGRGGYAELSRDRQYTDNYKTMNLSLLNSN